MRTVIPLIISGILLAGSASARHWHDDDEHWRKHAEHEDDDEHGVDHRAKACYFQPGDTRVITGYYRQHQGELPPGLQKKVYGTGHLPPGWAKRMQPLPVIVERRLTPIPAGYSRGLIDGYAVVYSPRTQVVVDIVAVFGR